MPPSAQREADTPARPRWPYLGRPQLLLGIAAMVTLVASFLPWLDVALLGTVWGAAAGGLYTFYAGMLALPGAAWRSPRIVAGHALLLALVAIAVPGWRLVWAFQRLPGFGRAWSPSPGMLLLLISGGVAAYAFIQLLPMATRGGAPAPRGGETSPV